MLLLLACTGPHADSAAPSDTAAASTIALYDGPAACGWMAATGYVDDHTLYQLRLTLPEADRLADADVAYDLALGAGDLTIWRADGGTDRFG